jgi:hypothetical protein
VAAAAVAAGVLFCAVSLIIIIAVVFLFGVAVRCNRFLFGKDRTRAGRQTIKRLSTNCLQENEHNFAAD